MHGQHRRSHPMATDIDDIDADGLIIQGQYIQGVARQLGQARLAGISEANSPLLRARTLSCGDQETREFKLIINLDLRVDDTTD